jgi:CRP/FNR family transcriptional regulator
MGALSSPQSRLGEEVRWELPPRAAVFRAGEDSELVFVLESGLVGLQRVSPDGAPVGLCVVRPGEVFGEDVLFDRPLRCFAETLVASVVSPVPASRLRRILRQRPEAAWALAEQLQARAARLMDSLEGLMAQDVRTRLLHTLLELAEALGGCDGDGAPPRLPVTQAQLANLIGATRQTVNAALGSLEAEGLVARSRGSLHVVRVEGLRAARAPSPAGFASAAAAPLRNVRPDAPRAR